MSLLNSNYHKHSFAIDELSSANVFKQTFAFDEAINSAMAIPVAYSVIRHGPRVKSGSRSMHLMRIALVKLCKKRINIIKGKILNYTPKIYIFYNVLNQALQLEIKCVLDESFSAQSPITKNLG